MPRKYAALFALLLAVPFAQAERFSLKDNENSSRYVVEKISELRGLTVEEVAQATYENAKKVFGLD